MAFSMQDLMARLPGSTPNQPSIAPSFNPQINKQDLATNVNKANIAQDRAKEAKNQKLALMLYALGGALGGKDIGESAMAFQQIQAQRQAQEQAKRQQEAASNYLKSIGASEEQQALVRDNPDLASQVLTQSFKQTVDKPASVQEFLFAQEQGFLGSYNDFRKSKSPMVNINQQQESEFVKRSVELGTEDIKETRKALQASSELLPRLETAQFIMQSPDFLTGPSQEVTLELRRLYNDLTGQDQKNVSQQELFNSMANYSIPRMRPPGSGATSDFEAGLYSRATIGLGNTKEGNELIVGTMVQQAKRDRILLDLKEEYYSQNKGDTTGFEKYLRDNDLVPPLYQQLNLNQQNLGEMYDQGKIKNGEVYIDLTNPRSPKLTVFRLSDFE